MFEHISEFAMNTCCEGAAKRVPTLLTLGVIANHTNTLGDITECVGWDRMPDEDPRMVTLVNVLRKKGIPLRYVDGDYLSDELRTQFQDLNLITLLEQRNHDSHPNSE